MFSALLTIPTPRLLADSWQLFDGLDQNTINTEGLGIVPHLLHNAINIALLLAGGLAVIFIVVGGLRYVLAAGNPAGVKQAKDTILYAIIGLILATASFAIVNFVIGI
jgi:hypothetical protein